MIKANNEIFKIIVKIEILTNCYSEWNTDNEKFLYQVYLDIKLWHVIIYNEWVRDAK